MEGPRPFPVPLVMTGPFRLIAMAAPLFWTASYAAQVAGSAVASGPAAIDRMPGKPRMAVISAGARNKFGHPHKETLERLEKIGAKIYRTDEMGTIIMRTDGTSVRVSRLGTLKAAGRAEEQYESPN